MAYYGHRLGISDSFHNSEISGESRGPSTICCWLASISSASSLTPDVALPVAGRAESWRRSDSSSRRLLAACTSAVAAFVDRGLRRSSQGLQARPGGPGFAGTPAARRPRSEQARDVRTHRRCRCRPGAHRRGGQLRDLAMCRHGAKRAHSAPRRRPARRFGRDTSPRRSRNLDHAQVVAVLEQPGQSHPRRRARAEVMIWAPSSVARLGAQADADPLALALRRKSVRCCRPVQADRWPSCRRGDGSALSMMTCRAGQRTVWRGWRGVLTICIARHLHAIEQYAAGSRVVVPAHRWRRGPMMAGAGSSARSPAKTRRSPGFVTSVAARRSRPSASASWSSAGKAR